MVSKQKAKGTVAERAVVDYLRANGFPDAERRALEGVNDRGDVAGLPYTVLEVKNHAALDLAGWLNELMREIDNDNAEYGAVVAKRRGHAKPDQWYAIMPFEMLVKMLGRVL